MAVTFLRIFPNLGWDSLNYKAFYSLWEGGKDPYSYEINQDLRSSPWVMTSPPLLLVTLCKYVSSSHVIGVIFAISLFLLAFLLYSPVNLYSLNIALLCCGAFWECLLSGNYAFIELFLIGGVIGQIRNCRYSSAGVMLGLATYLKLQPCLLAFIVLLWSTKRRTFFKSYFLTLLALWSLTVALFPVETSNYFGMAINTLLSSGGYSEMVNESMSLNSFLNNTLGSIGFVTFWSINFILLIIISYKAHKHQDDFIALCWLILISPLLLPRLTPYSLVWSIFPLLFICEKWSNSTKAIILLVSGFLPFLNFMQTRALATPIPFLSYPLVFFGGYVYYVFILACLAVLQIIHSFRTQGTAPLSSL